MLSSVLVLGPELSETLPGKLPYGHFLFLDFPFHFITNVLKCLIPSFVSGQSQGDVHVWQIVGWGCCCGIQVPLLHKTEEKKRGCSAV